MTTGAFGIDAVLLSRKGFEADALDDRGLNRRNPGSRS